MKPLTIEEIKTLCTFSPQDLLKDARRQLDEAQNSTVAEARWYIYRAAADAALVIIGARASYFRPEQEADLWARLRNVAPELRRSIATLLDKRSSTTATFLTAHWMVRQAEIIHNEEAASRDH